MQPTDLDLAKLSVAERIQLAEDLWDSIAADTGDIALTDAQRVELERRLADLQQDPDAGEPWSDVRARIEKRLAQAG
jgi:putative addiction module component (TIGR02574 family)